MVVVVGFFYYRVLVIKIFSTSCFLYPFMYKIRNRERKKYLVASIIPNAVT